MACFQFFLKWLDESRFFSGRESNNNQTAGYWNTESGASCHNIAANRGERTLCVLKENQGSRLSPLYFLSEVTPCRFFFELWMPEVGILRFPIAVLRRSSPRLTPFLGPFSTSIPIDGGVTHWDVKGSEPLHHFQPHFQPSPQGRRKTILPKHFRQFKHQYP